MATVLPTPSYDSLIDPSLRDDHSITRYPDNQLDQQGHQPTETPYDELLRQAQSLQQHQQSSLHPYPDHHDDSIRHGFPYDETQSGQDPPLEDQSFEHRQHQADVEAAAAAVMAYHAANQQQQVGDGRVQVEEGGGVGGGGGGGDSQRQEEGGEADRSLGQDMQAFWDALPLDAGMVSPLST
jgi:hypothetical protein